VSETFEPHRKWYVVEGVCFTHVFEDEDEANDFVLAEILEWHGRTREPETWAYVEEIIEPEIINIQRDIRIHRRNAA
jgi:hypothetical protein